jgi:chaperonin GroEL (HSP60 family)
MALEALNYTGGHRKNEFWRLDDIYVRTQRGASLAESRVVKGLSLLRERIHPAMKEHMNNGMLLLVRGEFNTPKKGKTQFYDHTFAVNSPEHYARLLRSKKDILLDVLGNVPSSGADVILVEKGVDDVVVDYLAARGVIVIRRFPPQEFDHVIMATGAPPVSDMNAVSASDLVRVERVDYRQIGGSSWWFLEGFQSPRSCEAFVRGPDELSLQEAERLLKSCFKLIRLYLQEPRVAYGGGWFEMAVARELRRFSRKLPTKEQLVVDKIADAFESVPAILAESSGLNSLDSVLDLRHFSEEQFMGVDGSTRRIEDMSAQEIVEPIHLKRQSIFSAFEATITVLRVDDVLRSRKLSKEEKYYLERLEKTTPEATRKIQREYGI